MTTSLVVKVLVKTILVTHYQQVVVLFQHLLSQDFFDGIQHLVNRGVRINFSWASLHIQHFPSLDKPLHFLRMGNLLQDPGMDLKLVAL